MESVVEKKEIDEIKEIFSQNLVFFRKKMNISQKELAEKLQTSNKNISKWERAETIPDILIIKKLAGVFNVTIDTLVSPITDEHKQAIVTKTAVPLKLKICFLCLIIGIIFLFSCVIFFILESIEFNYFPPLYIFIYTLPIIDLTIFIFICITSKKVDAITLSIFGWLITLSIFITFISYDNIGYIFIITLAYQVIAPLFAVLINSRKKIKFNKFLISLWRKQENDQYTNKNSNENLNNIDNSSNENANKTSSNINNSSKM